VLGSQTARELFPYEDPVGEFIQIDREFYRVIGETESKVPQAGIGGSLAAQDFNLDIYIPLSTLRVRIGDMVVTSRAGSREGEQVQLSQITVTVRDLDDVDQTAEMIRLLLQRFHPNVDYSITVPKELLAQAEVLQMMFNLLLVLIAGIALLVGGIGIMNIMLATVTERTREIGIRRALGAKQRDIVSQFLSETIVLSATGGALGVFLGFLCYPAIVGTRALMYQLFPDVIKALPPNIQQLEPRIAPWSIAAAFLISVGVGVIFGLYPAQRAAKMDPIEALRHE
jgi:putative ABC transport system permease protein